jgi:hypothetical protein
MASRDAQHSSSNVRRTHQRWTAASTQLDITGHEEIIQANKQHRRLIRRYGRPAVNPAFAQASSIIEEWALRPSYRDRFSQVMSSFSGDAPVFMQTPSHGPPATSPLSP